MNGNLQDGDAQAFQRIGILGGGAWGTALAQAVSRAGRDVTLWAYEFETVSEINSHHTNRVYLPGVALDPAIKATAKAKEVADADLILLVAPAQFLRAVANEIAPNFGAGKPIVICAKGFEEELGDVHERGCERGLAGCRNRGFVGAKFRRRGCPQPADGADAGL